MHIIDHLAAFALRDTYIHTHTYIYIYIYINKYSMYTYKYTCNNTVCWNIAKYLG